MKIKELIQESKRILKENNINDINLKLRIILSKLLNKPKEYIIIHEDIEIDDRIVQIFFKKIEDLKNNVPIQYIVNNQEFFGLDFYVDENVLIPQPDTEILVEETINLIQKMENIPNKKLKILDLCTGSGAIGISIAKNVEKSIVYASDISENALEIAKKNAMTNNIDINFIKSNLFENINEKFNIIVSNPPYIETEVIKTLSEEVRKEPVIALDGGIDGLDFYRKIAAEAKKYLENNGYLALEIGYNQKDTVEEILKQNSYKNIYSKKDFANNDRIVIAQI